MYRHFNAVIRKLIKVEQITAKRGINFKLENKFLKDLIEILEKQTSNQISMIDTTAEIIIANMFLVIVIIIRV